MQLTEAMAKRIDAFQMSGLRQIMKKTHTHYNRAHTNKHMLEEANKALNDGRTDGLKKKYIYLVNSKKRNIKLLGHVMRTDNEDPLRQVTLEDNTANRSKIGKLRVGKANLG